MIRDNTKHSSKDGLLASLSHNPAIEILADPDAPPVTPERKISVHVGKVHPSGPPGAVLVVENGIELVDGVTWERLRL